MHAVTSPFNFNVRLYLKNSYSPVASGHIKATLWFTPVFLRLIALSHEKQQVVPSKESAKCIQALAQKNSTTNFNINF